METVSWVILGIYFLVAAVAIIGIVYLIFRRIRIRKEENFEKRDN